MNPSSIAVPVHHHFYNVYIRCAPLFPEMTLARSRGSKGEGGDDDELVSGVQRQ